MPQTVRVTEQDLRGAMRDERYWRSGHPERAAFVGWVTDGFRGLYPSDGAARVAVWVRAYVRNGHPVAAHWRSAPPGGGRADDTRPEPGGRPAGPSTRATPRSSRRTGVRSSAAVLTVRRLIVGLGAERRQHRAVDVMRAAPMHRAAIRSMTCAASPTRVVTRTCGIGLISGADPAARRDGRRIWSGCGQQDRRRPTPTAGRSTVWRTAASRLSGQAPVLAAAACRRWKSRSRQTVPAGSGQRTNSDTR